NNATGYDDSILVIEVFDDEVEVYEVEVFDDDEEESKYELKESIKNTLQQLMKNLDKLKQVNEQIYELKEKKQENEQIRIEKLFFEQEYIRFRNKNLLLKQEIQRIKNEMNNNINAIQKQIYQMEEENRLLKYMRLQFKENLTLQLMEEIRRLTAKIEKKDTKLRVLTKYLISKINGLNSLHDIEIIELKIKNLDNFIHRMF
ncbi:4103_t:CDS:2, partial [Gigaspora margarita]